MAYLQDFWKDQWYNIMFVVVIMLTLIAVFSILGINFKDDQNKHLKKIVTIEAFGGSDFSDGLCSTYSNDPPTLEQKCNTLSEKNCKLTSCCGWLNKTKCVAGNSDGPNYHSKDGKPITISSWDFMK
jgi:hypothetical protein